MTIAAHSTTQRHACCSGSVHQPFGQKHTFSSAMKRYMAAYCTVVTAKSVHPTFSCRSAGVVPLSLHTVQRQALECSADDCLPHTLGMHLPTKERPSLAPYLRQRVLSERGTGPAAAKTGKKKVSAISSPEPGALPILLRVRVPHRLMPHAACRQGGQKLRQQPGPDIRQQDLAFMFLRIVRLPDQTSAAAGQPRPQQAQRGWQPRQPRMPCRPCSHGAVEVRGRAANVRARPWPWPWPGSGACVNTCRAAAAAARRGRGAASNWRTERGRARKRARASAIVLVVQGEGAEPRAFSVLPAPHGQRGVWVAAGARDPIRTALQRELVRHRGRN